jgi:hypothetical protein
MLLSHPSTPQMAALHRQALSLAQPQLQLLVLFHHQQTVASWPLTLTAQRLLVMQEQAILALWLLTLAELLTLVLLQALPQLMALVI